MHPQKYPENITTLRCVICGRELSPAEVSYVCPDHGDEGILDVRYDYDLIASRISPRSLAESRDWSQWRYRPLLPVLPETPAPPLSVGWTPLYETSMLAGSRGMRRLWVKDDSRQPTGSLKDRASALAVMKAREAGADVITTASTGNAAAALAGICASEGMKCIIFVPESAPKAKVAQLLAFGAEVFLVRGSYDDAFELCLQAAERYGWYNRNTGFNPYMVEGKKTVAFEICEQLGWRSPDQIYVPVGDGCIISGVHKGFQDLYRLGWVDRMPKLMGVQAAGSDFLARAAELDVPVLEQPPIVASTRADSISAGLPRDRVKAAAAVRETAGSWIRVSDEEILGAIPELARLTGVFAEPAAAAALAGLDQGLAQGVTAKDDEVVLLVTGSGLKDVDAAVNACSAAGRRAVTIDPDMESLSGVYDR